VGFTVIQVKKSNYFGTNTTEENNSSELQGGVFVLKPKYY
jgi:hypothetical protein